MSAQSHPPGRGWTSARRTPRAGAPAAWAITAVLGLILLILAPASSDLATASYRSDLFARAGLSLWDTSWYGGHHLPAYSLLAPGLGALVGPRLLAVVSMTAASALFARVIDGHFPDRAVHIAAAWFALGAAIGLLSWRVAFDLGLALGLASILAAQRGRPRGAFALAVLTALASPVAGAFLALACLARALAGPSRTLPSALALAALAPVGLLALGFPEGGTQPFVASAFYPALIGVLLIGALVPADQRALRAGVVLYALAMTGSFVIPTAVGGNVDRLGALLAGPLAACVLGGGSHARNRGRGAALSRGRGAALNRPAGPRFRGRGRLLAVLAPLLLYWQANAPVTDFVSAAGDPAVHASYFAPLLAQLRTLGVGDGGTTARIEVVPSVDHWEARWVAPHVMLARGWERQLDRYRNALFYDGAPSITPGAYRSWLTATAVSYVALPDAPLDYSARAEARLLREAPPGYLREVSHSTHWRLFAVLAPAPLAQPPSILRSVGPDSFTLAVPRAGSFVVMLHFTPYWELRSGHGCIARAPGDWTLVQAHGVGKLHVVTGFSLARVFDRGPRCR